MGSVPGIIMSLIRVVFAEQGVFHEYFRADGIRHGQNDPFFRYYLHLIYDIHGIRRMLQSMR